MLDFGTLRTMDEPKTLNLNVMNYGNKSLQILSVHAVPPNKALVILFNPIVLKGSKDRKYTKIATVGFSGLMATHKKQRSGKIVVTTSDAKKKLEILYNAHVLQG
jgi:hypothetical protein